MTRLSPPVKFWVPIIFNVETCPPASRDHTPMFLGRYFGRGAGGSGYAPEWKHPKWISDQVPVQPSMLNISYYRNFFNCLKFLQFFSRCRCFTPHCNANTIRSVRSVLPSLRLGSIVYSLIFSPVFGFILLCIDSAATVCFSLYAFLRMLPLFSELKNIWLRIRSNLKFVLYIFKTCVILLRFLLKFCGVFTQQYFSISWSEYHSSLARRSGRVFQEKRS